MLADKQNYEVIETWSLKVSGAMERAKDRVESLGSDLTIRSDSINSHYYFQNRLTL